MKRLQTLFPLAVPRKPIDRKPLISIKLDLTIMYFKLV